ncbi:glycosyltransferase [Pontibacter burrus]|uniref:Glycosyltransferase n=1 Tax=Pontibacter burrus TaxID=2704466 RepID=A0A6B3LSV4_9BACT|nr:glycosyltransferase [Pontibacter burrus]NEM98883.1 glycosyltransferase [Pontibacter burrus]
MVSKPKVLVFVDWFLPGYKAGGPIKSVANIVQSLSKHVDFSIITSNIDFGEPEPYKHIQANTWLQQDGFRVMYLDAAHQKLHVFRKLLQEENYQTLYFNSLFSVPYTLLPLLANKLNGGNAEVVLAPRGMLGPGALNLKKNKKRLFLLGAKSAGLFRGITWHASTSVEAEEIRAVFGGRVKVKVATNIASAGTVSTDKIKTAENTAFFFLSRISPKKNLLGALELLAALQVQRSVNFTILGPVEDEKYWQKCQEVISKLPENIVVHYDGAIPNPKLPEVLKSFHFMLLPTYSENYGHVIVEAWASGCPVIISDQTPWRNLEEEQVGWDLALDNKQAFIEVLTKCVRMGNNTYQVLSSNTQRFLQQRVITDEIIQQNKALFGVSHD